MAKPTITTAGTASGFLLITNQDGLVSRINKSLVCEVVDSSNARSYRIDLFHGNRETNLTFSNQTEVDAFLSLLDAEY